MNLFISDNFIDTIGYRVNVLQVIRQVAEDDDVIHSEVMASLGEVLDYTNTDRLEDAIREGDIDDAALDGDTLYLSGELLRDVFEDLFPGDHTVVITNLVNFIAATDSPTLRLDHNCVPVVDREPDQSEVPATVDAPFQGDPEGTEVPVAEVATLSSEAILGDLRFNGQTIRTSAPAGSNGVLFNATELYYAIYGIGINVQHLQQVLLQNSASIRDGDVKENRGHLYLSVSALSVIHPHLAPYPEWTSTIARVTTMYAMNPYSDLAFNPLGNRVG